MQVHPIRLIAAVLIALVALAVPTHAQAQTASTLYTRAQAREATARKNPTAANLRAAISAYENVVLRYPRSGYCDDALWYGALTARFAYEQRRQSGDLKTAERLFTWLKREYPASKYASKVTAQIAALDSLVAPPAPKAPPTPPAGSLATIKKITRSALPKGDRLTIELDREVLFHSERIVDPERVFFDLKNTAYDARLAQQIESVEGSRLTTLRMGQQANDTTRVVLELAGSPEHSVFALYHPYRLIVDIESDTPPPPKPLRPVQSAAVAPLSEVTALPPAPPAATLGGDYSLSRQLGLGISRIVIDPGHGGHDPGAQGNGVVEAQLVLDIALRVEALLKKQPGIDVILTRRTDEFIALEERTAIANRENADLFLSIHANAARRTAAKGVETYFLNFATNPDAEAVAARENAGSRTSMGKLPELVQQIALHDKMKESREFAQIVQTNMIRGLRTQNKALVDLGVKQAAFVVLIGAQMPSVLAEISFVTNKTEAALLKKDAYKDRIAQSLADAVLKYQSSLKKVTTTADATNPGSAGGGAKR